MYSVELQSLAISDTIRQGKVVKKCDYVRNAGSAVQCDDDLPIR